MKNWELTLSPFERDARRFKVRIRGGQDEALDLIRKIQEPCGMPFPTLAKDFRSAFFVPNLSAAAEQKVTMVLGQHYKNLYDGGPSAPISAPQESKLQPTPHQALSLAGISAASESAKAEEEGTHTLSVEIENFMTPVPLKAAPQPPKTPAATIPAPSAPPAPAAPAAPPQAQAAPKPVPETIALAAEKLKAQTAAPAPVQPAVKPPASVPQAAAKPVPPALQPVAPATPPVAKPLAPQSAPAAEEKTPVADLDIVAFYPGAAEAQWAQLLNRVNQTLAKFRLGFALREQGKKPYFLNEKPDFQAVLDEMKAVAQSMVVLLGPPGISPAQEKEFFASAAKCCAGLVTLSFTELAAENSLMSLALSLSMTYKAREARKPPAVPGAG